MRGAHLPTRLKSENSAKQDAIRHEKFEANINPTSDEFENYSDSLRQTACHDVCRKLSVGFQLLLEVELYFCVVNKKHPIHLDQP